MASTKFYLDTRGVKPGKTAALKLSITHKGKSALLSLNVHILPTQWDNLALKIVGHPNKVFLNMYICNRKQEVDNIILKLLGCGEMVSMSVADLKARIMNEIAPQSEEEGTPTLFAERFLRFAGTKKESTRGVYMQTYSRMRQYMGEDLDRLTFEDITKDWLVRFDLFLQKTAPSKNARNIHLRNIRAVFNDAIDDELTTFYPFRRFKIRPVPTAKRSLAVEQLRTLFSVPVEKHVEKYRDMFKLIFYLIGINVIDLCNLKTIVNGRIEYYRAKTGRLYSIKVEPEAMEIIDRYRGNSQLLDILDRYSSHKDYAKRLNENLQRIGGMKRVGRGGKKVFTPLFPNLTTYWARHTWATIAASLDIPKETIAAALGHGGNTVTDIYIDFDQRKVDEANRKVIDYLNEK